MDAEDDVSYYRRLPGWTELIACLNELGMDFYLPELPNTRDAFDKEAITLLAPTRELFLRAVKGISLDDSLFEVFYHPDRSNHLAAANALNSAEREEFKSLLRRGIALNDCEIYATHRKFQAMMHC